MNKKLETKRLVLRPYRKSDAKNIVEKINHKEIVIYLFGPPYPYKMKDANWFINDSLKKSRKGKSHEFAITLKETGELIGGTGVNRIDKKNSNANVGYWIAKEYQGKGYATEAAKKVVEFGFMKLKLMKLHAKVVSVNPASSIVLQKIGFKREGILRKHTKDLFANKWYDEIVYGLLKQEWKK